MTDEEITQDAKAHAKTIRNELARDIVDGSSVPDEEPPLSIFMAGAPGAGKTEASKELVQGFDIIRVDPDDFRDLFPRYGGGNSRLFQGAVALLVERVHDRLLRGKKSFLLDGTFANLKVARQNISRSIKRGREVRVWYVFQDPALSWGFVQAREVKEGRGIPLDSFIDQYFNSRFVIRQIKEEFEDQVVVDVLVKQFDQSDHHFHENVIDIDAVCRNQYTRESLRALLASEGENGNV